MTRQFDQAKDTLRRGNYSSPTLSIYGGVANLTAAGTQPPTENSGTGGIVKLP